MSAIHADRYSCMEDVRVRLTKKFAEEIDGVDLSGRSVGEVFRLPEEQARLLMAEHWAVPAAKKDARATRDDDGRPSNFKPAESF